MATCIDHHSSLARRITYPAPGDDGARWCFVPLSPQGAENGGMFESSLIESGRKLPKRNPWATVGAVAFQVLLLAGLVIIPLYHTDVLPKRETLTMLYLAPPSAPPPLAIEAPRRATPTVTSTAASIPNPIEKAQEAAPPAETSSGVAGGVFGGVIGGISVGAPAAAFGAVLSSTHTVPVLAKSAEAPAPKRIRLAARVAEGNLIHDVTPVYPPEAGRARMQGVVTLIAVIGKDGRVEDVRVVSGAPLLVQAALEAVRQWRYRPYMLDGQPVEVDAPVVINFTLSGV